MPVRFSRLPSSGVPGGVVYLMRILILRHKPVDKSYKSHASEETQQHIQHSQLRVGHYTLHALDRIGHKLHKRHIDHNTRRQSQSTGQMMVVAFLCKECHKSAYSRSHACNKRKQQRNKYIVESHHRLFNYKYINTRNGIPFFNTLTILHPQFTKRIRIFAENYTYG